MTKPLDLNKASFADIHDRMGEMLYIANPRPLRGLQITCRVMPVGTHPQFALAMDDLADMDPVRRAELERTWK